MTINKKRPKKRPPKKTVSGGTAIVPATSGVIREPVSKTANTKDYRWLRKLAGLKFITSQQSVTLAGLLEDPELKDKVSLASLKLWSAQDNWVQRRSDYYKNLEEGIRAQIAKRQIRTTVDQLAELDEVSTKLLEALNSADTEVGTLEGVTTAYLRIVNKREALRDRIVKEITPEGLAGGVPVVGNQVTPVLSAEEAREAAMLIVRRRREAQRKRIQEAETWLDDGLSEQNGD